MSIEVDRYRGYHWEQVKAEQTLPGCTAAITAVGAFALAQDTKGTHKQITFNNATSLHDVLYKRRKPRKTDDVIPVLYHVQCRANKVKRSWKRKDTFHADKIIGMFQISIFSLGKSEYA
jgi:hypothetical protein